MIMMMIMHIIIKSVKLCMIVLWNELPRVFIYVEQQVLATHLVTGHSGKHIYFKPEFQIGATFHEKVSVAGKKIFTKVLVTLREPLLQPVLPIYVD